MSPRMLALFVALLQSQLSCAQQCSKYQLPNQTAIQAAEKVPTGNHQCALGTKFFPQKIDHSDETSSSNIFLQQYEVNATYFKPGGPILYWQNPELPYQCINGTSGPDWAAELDGMVISLEQRYFGISTPYGLNFSNVANWTTEEFGALTLENSLLDAVTFVEWIRCTYPGAKDSKVIVYGGSYPGFLTLQLRVRYPDVFFGGLASSSVSNGLDVTQNSKYIYAWGDWASQVTNEISALAASKIEAAFNYLRERYLTSNFDGLQKPLSLCTPVNTSDGLLNVGISLFNYYTQNVQNNRAAFKNPMLQTIDTAIKSNDSLEILGSISTAFFYFNPPLTCIDWDAPNVVTTPFNWIQCNFVPYSNPYSSNSSIFGAFGPNLNYPTTLDPSCLQWFNQSANPGGIDYQRSIHIDQETLDNTTRLIMAENLWDVVTPLGPNKHLPATNANESRMYYVPKTSHIEDILAARADDPVGLTDARKFYVQTFKEWLGRV